MSSLLGFVPSDGYTERAYLAEIPRLYPALRFTFRPLLQSERGRLISENAKITKATEAALNTAKVLCTKIKSWDLRDKAGDLAPIKPETIQALKPALYERLVGVVMGLEAPDEDPEALPTSDEAEASLADQLTAQEKGVPVGDAREARDAKNS